MSIIPSRSASRAATAALFVLLAATGCSSGGSADAADGDGGDGPPQGETATAGAYLPDDGLIVIEFESGVAAGSWANESGLSGFAGAAYLRWAGANEYSTPGVDAFGFDFWIENPGAYDFRIHNRHDHGDSTLANDLWVRVDEGDWVKTFSWQRGEWTWVTNHEFSHSNKPEAEYVLSAGNHHIEFSGRSTDFSVDRFHLFDADVIDPLNTSHAESTRAGASSGMVAPGSAGMIGADRGRTSLVELDAAALSPLASGSWVGGIEWSIPGATFIDGTGTGSLAPLVVVSGGAALPVKLTLGNEEGVHHAWGVLNVAGAPAVLEGELVVGGTIELHMAALDSEVIELVGPSGESLRVQSIPSEQGSRVTLVLPTTGVWTYRGRDAATAETFMGSFMVVAATN